MVFCKINFFLEQSTFSRKLEFKVCFFLNKKTIQKRKLLLKMFFTQSGKMSLNFTYIKYFSKEGLKNTESKAKDNFKSFNTVPQTDHQSVRPRSFLQRKMKKENVVSKNIIFCFMCFWRFVYLKVNLYLFETKVNDI